MKGIKNASISSRYELLRLIGEGRYSRVYLARHKINLQFYALKHVQLFGLCQFEIQNSLQQALILHCINHQNIIKIYQCLLDTQQDSLYMILEYAEEGDLYHLLQRHKEANNHIKESLIWKIIYDIVLGLHHIHKISIIHRDIKPANILLTKQGCKISDFNIATINPQLHNMRFGGTPNYLSPQKFRQQSENDKSDIWAVGILGIELCCLSNPHSSRELCEINQFMDINGSIGSIPGVYSQTLQYLLQSMVVKVENRPSAVDILDYCKKCGISKQIITAKHLYSIYQFICTFRPVENGQAIDIFSQYRSYLNQIKLLKQPYQQIQKENIMVSCIQNNKKIVRLMRDKSAKKHNKLNNNTCLQSFQ